MRSRLRQSIGSNAALAGRWAGRAVAAVGAFVRRWDKDALAKAERQARLAEQRLRGALDALPEGIVFLDSEGRYILWNQRYAEIYRRSADLFAVGAKLADTLRVGVARGDYPDALGREEQWLAQRLDLLVNAGERHEQRLADGRWLMIEERKTVDGDTIGIRVDITELKQQAEALRLALTRAEAASRAKSDFLANMGHELRTPLNGVLGLASALAAGDLKDGQREIVQTIIDSASGLEILLSDLLTFAEVGSGRLELASEPLDLRSMLEAVAARFRAEAERKGLALDMDFTGSGGEPVLGDAERLGQVIGNLVSNAVKFTAQGAVTIRLKTETIGAARRQVIEVADTGIGFEPDEAERLFGMFEQGDNSSTRRFGGAGLGLAICRQLMALMGGTVHAQGRLGEGATFIVSLQPE